MKPLFTLSGRITILNNINLWRTGEKEVERKREEKIKRKWEEEEEEEINECERTSF